MNEEFTCVEQDKNGDFVYKSSRGVMFTALEKLDEIRRLIFEKKDRTPREYEVLGQMIERMIRK